MPSPYANPMDEEDGGQPAPAPGNNFAYGNPMDEEPDEVASPAPVAKAEKYGSAYDMALGALDGLLMNYGGEIGKVGSAIGNSFADLSERVSGTAGRPSSQPYDNSVSPVNDALHTTMGKAGSIGGNILSGVSLGAATGGVGNMAAQGAIGAGLSAVAGAGAREGEERFNPAEVAKDAGVGGALGMLGRGIGNYLGAKEAKRLAIPPRPVMAASEPLGAPWVGPAVKRARPVEAEAGEWITRNGDMPSAIEQSIDPKATVRIPGRGGRPLAEGQLEPSGLDVFDPKATVRIPKEQVRSAADDIATVRDLPKPPSTPYQRPQEIELTPVQPGRVYQELGPAEVGPGMRDPGAMRAAEIKRRAAVTPGWEGIAPYAPELLQGKLPVRALSREVARRMFLSGPGAVKPDVTVVRGVQSEVMGVGRGAAAFPSDKSRAQDVARPDMPTLSWAMQSVNAAGDTGLPPEAQSGFDEALMSGDDNKVSSAYMRLSMKYPAFQKRMIKELESINNGD